MFKLSDWNQADRPAAQLQGWDRSNGIAPPRSSAYAAFWILALTLPYLMAIWGFDTFFSQDGPAHLHNAAVLREYWWPQRAVFREYYTINSPVLPNWSGHVWLAGLMYAAHPLIAEKVLLSAYVVLLPLSVCYALSRVRRGSEFLAVLVVPFVGNWFFHMGFYNFLLGTVAFAFLLGCWFGWQERLTAGRTATLCALALFLYWSHLFAFALASATIGALLVLSALGEVANARGKVDRRAMFSSLRAAVAYRALPTVLAFIPAASLATVFAIRTVTRERPTPEAGATDAQAASWGGALRDLFGLDVLISFGGMEAYAAAGMTLFLSALTVRGLLRGPRPAASGARALPIMMVGYVAAYFVSRGPRLENLYVRPRLTLYLALVLVLWLGTLPYSRRTSRLIVVGGAILSLTLAALHIAKYREFDPQMREYLSAAPFLEPNSTLLPIPLADANAGQSGSPVGKVDPFLHAAGYLAAMRGLVDLGNYEGYRHYFPVQFRGALNPERAIYQRSMDFLTYPQRTGGRVDYVVLWGVPDTEHVPEGAQDIFAQLHRGYDLIYTSPGRGFVRLYRRK